MPPTLDLSKTYTYTDMMLSSRKSPRISLRKAASYNGEKAPLSSTSSRFSFNHLLSSPPASPSLPALVPRHGKPVPKHTPRRWARATVWVTGVTIILYFAFSLVRTEEPVDQVGWANHAGEEFEMVGDSELPDFPTPVVVTDKRGRSKWTVSIPPNHEFPLAPKMYAEICMQNAEVSNHVEDLHAHTKKIHQAHYGYYHVDSNFMDVAEAEAHGLLPGAEAKTDMDEDTLVGEEQESLIESEVCEKSMTFLLETEDAGMGKTLMMLWTAYGLAQKEGRDFFLDDSRWAYGKYTNFFLPPPVPKCRPPPRHEMLPCPHHARHLVVSAATAGVTFGGAFNEEFENPRKQEVYRQEPMFNMARAGYEALFQLRSDDATYVSSRLEEIRNKSTIPESNASGMVVGIHVRHGDTHPLEFQYRDSYVPLDRFSAKAKELIQTEYNNTGLNGGNDLVAERHSFMVVASDDPDVYDSEELKDSLRAQDLIRLASHPASPKRDPELQAIRKFVDETPGWEGGFFSGMFWSLGRAVKGTNAMEEPETSLGPGSEAFRLRELVGRAYLMDLSVVGAGDQVICTVSSMGCKLLAVMMGWEKAIVQERWINIDGDFEWRGVPW